MFRMTLLCAIVAAGAVGAQGRDKGARKADDIDRLSIRLERDARELREEVIAHFRKSPVYKDMERHAREIEGQAARIHKLAYDNARPRLVREAIGKIDEEVREMDRHVLVLAREKAIDRKAFDHLRDEIADIGRILYRMRRDLP
jgi:hypothetical protein